MVQKPLLFLDIDGVLFLGVSTLEGLYDSDPFDKQCVSGLNAIIEKTNCEIVITSSWQNDYSLEELREIFAWNGVIYTPMQFSSPGPEILVRHDRRSQEILDWINANNTSGLKDDLRWCVIDDLDLGARLENFVKCDPNVGLKDKEAVSKAIVMLSE